jgi:hypothetical protein
MASFKNNLPSKRTTTYIIVVISLLAIFLLPYIYFFIPYNESTLQQQAYLKLKQASKNIINKEIDSRNYFKFLNTSKDSDTTSALDGLGCGRYNSGNSQDSIFFKFYNKDGWHILFEDSVVARINKPPLFYEHHLPLSGFIEPSVQSSRELFQTQFLTDYCTKGGIIEHGRDSAGIVIYQDARSSVDQNVNIDSLVPKTQGIRSPAIIDISMQGISYKMFTYPFLLSQHHLVLCGLMKSSVYSDKLHVIPVPVVYTLLILIVLFVLSLPFLKIFMMNDHDRVNKNDLVNGSRFLFATATFIVIVAVQLFLLWQGHKDVQNNLYRLSGEMTDSLSKELDCANKQLVFFDTTLGNYYESRKNLHLKSFDSWDKNNGDYGSARYILADTVKDSAVIQLTTGTKYKDTFKFNNKFLFSKPGYSYFDQVGWIDKSGQESIRFKFFSRDSIPKTDTHRVVKSNFVDVRQRDYYKYLSRLNESDDLTGNNVYIAPVYSWASSEFRVNICRKSVVPGMFIQVMQSRLYSLVNTAMSAGYGFCLIQEDGTVLIHSDTLKSLRENFLEETLQPEWIKAAIASRQSNSSFSQPFYGKWYAVRIQPVNQTPLFLVTFYDKSYLEPLNIRIFLFGLSFSILTYLLLYFLYLFRYPRPAKSFLFSSTDSFSWLIPHKHLINNYFNGSLVCVIYALTLMVSSLCIARNTSDDDYTLLIITLLTPFNLLFPLNLLRKTVSPGTLRESIRNMAVPIVASLVVLVLSYRLARPVDKISFYLIEGWVIVSMIAIGWKNGYYWYAVSDLLKSWMRAWLKWDGKTKSGKKIFAYSWFITMFIIAIAVVPVYIFSWFAYRQELVDTVKKEQLNLAKDLDKRKNTVKIFLKQARPDLARNGSTLFNNIQYTHGIYSIYQDIILYDSNIEYCDSTDNKKIQSEPFYQDVAGLLDFRYNDPTNLPAIKNTNRSDNLWTWILNKNTMQLAYTAPAWKIPPVDGEDEKPDTDIRIISALPAKIGIMSPPSVTILLFLLITMAALFKLIQSLAGQVFLLKIVDEIDESKEMGDENDPGIWKNCFDRNKQVDSVAAIFKDDAGIKSLLKQEYIDLDIYKSTDIPAKEKEYAKRAEDLKPLFACAWNKCSDPEKFLLFGLANDGLLNHKNEAIIYKMFLEKLLIVQGGRVKLISYSFRLFILSKKGTREEKDLLAKMQSGGSWASMRAVFFVVVLAIVVFLFLTQQEVSGKIIALITSLATIIPLLLKFGSGSKETPDAK